MANPEMEGVELPAIEFLQKMGWEYRKGKEINVESRAIAPIISDVFSKSLKKFNPWIDEIGIEKALRELRKINEESLMLSNQKFWEEFVQKSKFQLTITEKGHTVFKTVKFFDSVKPKNNHFCVVNQFVGKNANEDQFRPDLLLFVNGLPLGTIECKASHEKLSSGISQLLGYQKTFPKQFYFNQVCASINRVSGKYGAIGTPAQFYFDYRLEDTDEKKVKKLAGETPNEQQRLLWALFEPSRFIELVRHFVLFEQEEHHLLKKLPRYQQWRAVSKTIARIKKDQGGVVWHTQGSGKSLTMGMLSRLLRAEETGLDNPSILVLTDRTDLDRQIFNTFTNIGLKTEKAISVAGLQSRLSNDYGGVFTSTIQKFQEVKGEASKKNKTEDSEATTRLSRIEREGSWFMLQERKNEEGEWITEKEHEIDFSVLSTKKNFYVLVDEAHRSHYGFLGAFMRASLPDAKMIAFTGTPLLKTDKNTLKEFGGNKESAYIDVYALHESVRDGFTLPIKYLDGLAEQKIDGKLEKDFDEETKEKSKAKQALMRQKLIKDRHLSKARIREIAKHLVDNYEKNGFAKGFKAMLVCNGRNAAIAYKEALNEIMEERKKEKKDVFESRVVISLGSITANRSGDSTENNETTENEEEKDSSIKSIEERVREAVKNKETPIALPSDEIPNFTNKLFKLPFGDENQNTTQQTKVNNVAIVIVSDMLLTGYDAPILSTLYLDKPLKEHTLLQAVARVNRTRKGKNAGYFMDYYGVVSELDKALADYGGDIKTQDLMESPVSDIPKLQAACEAILSILPKKHDIFKEREKYKEDAEKQLDPEEHLDKLEDFLEAFSKFNKLLDIVLPDPAGVEFQPYFKIFKEIKQTVRQMVLGNDELNEIITAEESLLLTTLSEKHISSDPVVSLLSKEVSIFDREEFDKLKRLSAGKAALIKKNQLKQIIRTGREKEPGFFGDLDKELERLIAEEKAGKLEQSSFLEQMDSVLNQIRSKDNVAQDAGFQSQESIATFNYLKEHSPEMASDITKQLFELKEFSSTLKNPKWHCNAMVVEDLEMIVRRHLKGVSGWERKTAKQHAKKIIERLKAG